MRVGLALITLLLMPWSFADTPYGEWAFFNNASQPTLTAGTLNESGNIFGQLCFKDRMECIYFLDIDITCEDEHEYPLLINSNLTSGFADAYCLGNQLVFTDFDLIDNLARKANRVGFVLPMQDATFKVARFGLIKSSQAIDAMINALQNSDSTSLRSTQPETIEHRM